MKEEMEMPSNNLYDQTTGYMRPGAQPQAPVAPVVNQQDEEMRKILNDSIRKIQENQPYNSGLNSLASPDLSSDFGKPKTSEEIRRSREQLPIIVDAIRSNTPMTYAESREAFREMSALNVARQRQEEGILGAPINIPLSETHDIVGDTALPKFDYYTPGIDNQERAAQMQTTGEKWANGFKKLALKTGLYGVSGVAFPLAALAGLVKKGSISGIYDNSFTDFINNLDERINHSFAHYYTREEENMSLLRKLGTANFWANEFIGNGLSFTTGAMLTAWMTGGLGLANLASMGARTAARNAAARLGQNLGRVGARAGARSGYIAGTTVTRAGNALSMEVKTTGRTMEVSQAVRNAATQTKNALSDFRRGFFVRPNLSNAAKVAIYGGVSAGWESAVEANSTIKEAEQNFRDYIKNNYGRDATPEEMAEARKAILPASNTVFMLNLAVVGSSNMFLFGKALGINNYAFKNASNSLKRSVNKHLFGIGVKSSASKPGEMVAINANLGQKIARTAWNISKRPLSEGFYEEGLQGVFQNAAGDYIRSHYDKNAFEGQMSVWDATMRGFKEQYSSQEGWTEITLGAMIGALFGAREGFFGAFEGRNAQRRMAALAEEYNKNNAFTNSAVKEFMKRSLTFNSFISHSQQESNTAYGDSNTDLTEFNKFELSDQMGTLDSDAKEFEETVKNLDVNELLRQIPNRTEQDINGLKQSIIDGYKSKLERFKEAKRFTSEVLDGTNYTSYAPFVAEVAYKGLSSRSRIIQSANDIAEIISSDQDISDGLKIRSAMSKKSTEKAAELSNIQSEIQKLTKEIEKFAANTEGVSTDEEKKSRQAEIEKRYNELSNLESEAEKLREEVATLAVEDFSLDNMLGSAQKLLNESSPTADQVLAAYDAVRAVDYYLAHNKGTTERSSELEYLVDEYKMNVTNYKNLIHLLDSFNDPRYMREHISMFDRMFDSFIKEQYPSMDENYIPDERNDSKVTKEVDERIQKALEDGKMSPGEAFTAKLFNHIRDEIKDAPFNQRQDPVTDEEANALTSNQPLQPDDPNAGRYEKILQDIARRVKNKFDLSSNEKRIYKARKKAIDDMAKNLAGNTKDMLDSLKKTMDNYLKPEDELKSNRNVIEASKSLISDAAEQTEYEDLTNRYLENLKDPKMSEDELDSLKKRLEEIANAYNLQNPIPFLDNIHSLETESGDGRQTTATGFGLTPDSVDVINNESESGDENYFRAQNPSILVSRTVDSDGTTEFSNLDPKSFLEKLGKELEARGIQPDLSPRTKQDGGKPFRTLSWSENGENVQLTVYEFDHGRFRVNAEGLAVLRNSFGITTITGTQSYTLVGKRDANGNVTPFETGVNYNGSVIDQDALSKLKSGDELELEIDMTDDWNKKLFESAKGNKEKFSKSVRIKIIRVDENGNRHFVSVLGETKESKGIRSSSLYRDYEEALGKSDSLNLGKVYVRQYMPGRPMVTQENGRIVQHPIQGESLKNIKDVGYIINGELKTYSGESAETYPYATQIIRGKDRDVNHRGYKGVAVPVVIFEAPNGVRYVYPVKMRRTTAMNNPLRNLESEVQEIKNDDSYVPDASMLQEVNNLVKAYGIYGYHINPNGTIEEQRKQYLDAYNALLEAAEYPPVTTLLDKSRSVEDIVGNDVEATTDFSAGTLYAPKIRISRDKQKESDSTEYNPAEDELGGYTPTKDSTDTETQEHKNTSTDSQSLDELPFGGGTNNIIHGNPSFSATNSEGSANNNRRSSSKNGFDNLKFTDKNGNQYISFFDFLSQKLGFGDLIFLKGKGKGTGGLQEFIESMGGSYKSNTNFDKKPKGEDTRIPVSGYYDWLLENRDVPVVDEYLKNLPQNEEDARNQAMRDLFSAYKVWGGLPSMAVGYARSAHGEDPNVEILTHEDGTPFSSSEVLDLVSSKFDELKSNGVSNTSLIETVNKVVDSIDGDNTTEAVKTITETGVFDGKDAEDILKDAFSAVEGTEDGKKLEEAIEYYGKVTGQRKDEESNPVGNSAQIPGEAAGTEGLDSAAGTGVEGNTGTNGTPGGTGSGLVTYTTAYDNTLNTNPTDDEKMAWLLAAMSNEEFRDMDLVTAYKFRFDRNAKQKDIRELAQKYGYRLTIGRDGRITVKKAGSFLFDIPDMGTEELGRRLLPDPQFMPDVVDSSGAYSIPLRGRGETSPVDRMYSDKGYLHGMLRGAMNLPFTGWYVLNVTSERNPVNSDNVKGYITSYFFNPSTGDSFAFKARNSEDIPTPSNRAQWGLRMAGIGFPDDSGYNYNQNKNSIYNPETGKEIKGKCQQRKLF